MHWKKYKSLKAIKRKKMVKKRKWNKEKNEEKLIKKGEKSRKQLEIN